MMKASPKLGIVLLLLLSLLLTFTSIGAQDATEEMPVELTGDPVRIGIAVSQSGTASLFGQEQVIGAELARDYFNERGGINGRPIELVFQDAGTEEASAINAFTTLISGGVVGIVGPTLSQQAFAADPLAEDTGIPVIGPSNTAPGVPEIGDFISRVSAPVTVVAPNAVNAALALNPDIETVAVFYAQNDAFSSSETVVFQQVVADLELDVLPVQQFQTTDTDFTTQITNVLAPEPPDLVIISGLAVDSGNLVRQLRELGYEGVIVGGNGLNSPNMFPVCQALCDGVIVAQAYSPLAEIEINEALVEAYTEAQERTPGQFTAQAFTAVQAFVEALRVLDDEVGLDTLELDDLRVQLNDTLLGVTFESPLGPISFTEEGDVVQDQFYVAQIEMSEDGSEGRFVLVELETEE